MTIERINANLPISDKVRALNDMIMENYGKISQGTFDENELVQMYADLSLDRKFLRNVSLGNTLSTYGDWEHLVANVGYSIWKIPVSNYEYNSVNQLFFDNKELTNAGNATSETVQAYEAVYEYDDDASGGGGGYIDYTTEAGTEAGTPFSIIGTTDNYMYFGDSSAFYGISFDFATKGSGYTLKFEYWNGVAWTTLVATTNTLVDNTANLTSNGTVTWDTLSSWATTEINGATKYWIRMSTTVTPTTIATCYKIVDDTSVVDLLNLSNANIIAENWAWCYYDNNVYVTIRNEGTTAYEGNYYITSTSSATNLQNFFIYNHEYKTDYEDSTYSPGRAGVPYYQAPVISKGEISPPSGPSDGDSYLVISGESGSYWFGYDNYIAEYWDSDSSWHFTTPLEGMMVHVNDEDLYYVYSGSAWEALSSGGTFISDADGDTKVETERTPDDDTIYFKTAGTDRMSISSTGLITFTQNLDTITLEHDGDDAYMKWSDGYLYLMTDEGTNTDTIVSIKGKGTGNSYSIVESTQSFIGFSASSVGQLIFDSADGLYVYGQAYSNRGTSTGRSEVVHITLSETVFNDNGNDINLRIEGNTNANCFNLDAGSDNITINAAAVSAHYDLMLAGDGVLGLKETSTPTADADYGKIYCKNDNKLYFQDGAGTEHDLLDSGSDEKVKIDSGATAGYLGAASSDGVLRSGSNLSYVDGGDYITLDVDSTKATNWDAAYSHSQDNTQAHTDYLVNNDDDTTTGTLTVGGLTDGTATLTSGNLTGLGVLVLPNGAGGTTVDATGEICVDSTSRTLNYYDGTAEVVVQPIMSKSITVESPTSSEDISLFYIDDASTIVKIVAVLTGSDSQSVTWTVRHGTDRSATGAEVVTGGTTTTSLTTGSVVTSFNDATIVADSFVWLETTALGDTTDSLNITIYYRQDA